MNKTIVEYLLNISGVKYFLYILSCKKSNVVNSKHENGVKVEVQLYGYRPGSNVHNNRVRERTNGNSLFVWTCIVLFRGHTVLWSKQ